VRATVSTAPPRRRTAAARPLLGGLARGPAAGLVAAGIALGLAGCGGGEPAPGERAPAPPMIVIGIDGAEWSVIERLWAEGELPALRALAERGTRARLATDYGSSPVIWTTIATGRRPEVHGIEDFVVATARGDVPVSSDARKVPALWNMASAAGRRVAVLGWWASWPAEEVDGVVVSDRALQEEERRTWPPELAARIPMAGAARRLPAEAPVFSGGPAAGDRPTPQPATATPGPAGEAPRRRDSGWDGRTLAQLRDELMSEMGRELAPEGFDLMLVYFRAVDVESHAWWRYLEPEKFPPPDSGLSAAELAARADRIPRVYRATDRAIGEIVAAAPEGSNVLVVSDHGFRAADDEEILLLFDLDAVLERLGYLVRGPGGGVDVAASTVHGHRSPAHRRLKLVRFGGAAPPGERDALLRRLTADLAGVTWAGGEPVFEVREAAGRERREGAEFTVWVRRHGATPEVLIDGEPFAGAVVHLAPLSGTHHAHTAGILIAAGPEFEPGAEVAGISIHDLAPTILYGLGLPAAEDFAGRAWTELYTERFRRRHPPTTIATWGTREPGAATRSQADEELLEELGALGYLR